MGKGKASQGRLPSQVGQKTTSAAERLAHHLPLRNSMGLVGLQAEESAVWCVPATRSLTAPPGKSIRQIRASLRPPVRPHHSRPPLLAYRMKFHNTRARFQSLVDLRCLNLLYDLKTNAFLNWQQILTNLSLETVTQKKEIK